MSIFEIYDGRPTFWQWDLDRKLVVNDAVCREVHFCNGTADCSLVCEVYEMEGQRVADVPNILLQTARPISVYAYLKGEDGGYTKKAALFEVRRRTRPADYVYTETEVKSWDALDARIKELEKGGTGGGSAYVLPVGGNELGGVKNGGNVVINADGTMDAPTGGGSGSNQPLTFTGAVEATYDGSRAVTVDIPQGGGGEWRLADSYTLEEDVASIEWTGDTEVNEMLVAMNGIVNNEANDLANATAAVYVRGVKATGDWTGNILSGKNMFFVRTGGAFPSYLSFTRRGNYIEAKGMQCESQTYGTATANFGVLPTDSFVGFMLSFNNTAHRAKAGMTVEVYVR